MSRRSKNEAVKVFAAVGFRVIRRISAEQAVELERQGIIHRAPVPQLQPSSSQGVIRYDAMGCRPAPTGERLGFRLVGNSRLG